MTKLSFFLASTLVVADETPDMTDLLTRKCGDIDIEQLIENIDVNVWEELSDLSSDDIDKLKAEFEKIKTQLPDGVEEAIEEILGDGKSESKNLRGRSLMDEPKPDIKKKKEFAAKCKAGKGNYVDIDGLKFNAKDFFQLVCDDDSKGDLKVTGKDRHGNGIHKKITKQTKIKCMKAKFCRKPSMKKAGKMKFGKEFPKSTSGHQCQDKESTGTCEFQCENPAHVVKNFEPKSKLTDEQQKELEDKVKEVEDKAKELGEKGDDGMKEIVGGLTEQMEQYLNIIKETYGDLSEEEIQAKLKEMMENQTVAKDVENQLGQLGEDLKEIIEDNEDLAGKTKEVMENGELKNKLGETLKNLKAEGKYHMLQLFCDTDGDGEEGFWRLGGKDGPVVDDTQVEDMECGVAAADDNAQPSSAQTMTASVIFLGLTAIMV